MPQQNSEYFAELLANFQKMNFISDQMRESNPETAELEKAKKLGDTFPLLKVDFPNVGGVYSWMAGNIYPYEGFPLGELVERIDLLKKISRSLLSGIFHTFKNKSRFRLIFLLPILFFLPDLFRVAVYTYQRILERFKLKPLRYSRTARELIRAFSKDYAKETEKEKDLRLKIGDCVCMLLEFDNAYRFRFQDIIPELDKEALKKNTIKEILRLLDLMSSRETTQTIKDTWTLIRLAIKWYLRFDKKVQSIIRNVFLELDLKRLNLSQGDRYFCVGRKDYVFGFMKDQELVKLIEFEKELFKAKSSIVTSIFNYNFNLMTNDELISQLEKQLKEVEIDTEQRRIAYEGAKLNLEQRKIDIQAIKLKVEQERIAQEFAKFNAVPNPPQIQAQPIQK